MKKQTARMVIIGIAINVMLFVAIAFAIQEDFKIWQYIAIWGTIAIFNSILILWENPEHKPRTIVIKVKAWDNQEVRIRALRMKELIEAMHLQLDNRWGDADALIAHYAMVDPNISYDELIDMDENKLEGIIEIAEASERIR